MPGNLTDILIVGAAVVLAGWYTFRKLLGRKKSGCSCGCEECPLLDTGCDRPEAAEAHLKVAGSAPEPRRGA
jgi:hypothetical protein